jgi:hypothetical protein
MRITLAAAAGVDFDSSNGRVEFSSGGMITTSVVLITSIGYHCDDPGGPGEDPVEEVRIRVMPPVGVIGPQPFLFLRAEEAAIVDPTRNEANIFIPCDYEVPRENDGTLWAIQCDTVTQLGAATFDVIFAIRHRPNTGPMAGGPPA